MTKRLMSIIRAMFSQDTCRCRDVHNVPASTKA
jgi:hypothetical protein